MPDKTYKIAFDLSVEYVDAAIKAYGRDHVRSKLIDALNLALADLQPSPKSGDYSSRIRVVDEKGDLFMLWADVAKLCDLANPAQYLRKRKRNVMTPWRSVPMVTVPINDGIAFIFERGYHVTSRALADKYMPPDPTAPLVLDVDFDGRPIPQLVDVPDDPEA